MVERYRCHHCISHAQQSQRSSFHSYNIGGYVYVRTKVKNAYTTHIFIVDGGARRNMIPKAIMEQIGFYFTFKESRNDPSSHLGLPLSI
jgi:hypothetical protein